MWVLFLLVSLRVGFPVLVGLVAVYVCAGGLLRA